MMMRLLLVAVIVAGTAAGLLWPGSAAQPPAGPGTQVTIDRASDSHFYADAEVNGHPVRFLIDTGASQVALTEKDAKRAGVPFDPQSFGVVGEGASGIVRGKDVELASLNVGALGEKNVEAVIVEGGAVSLLGQPFLQGIDEIVITKDRMVLKDYGN